MCNVQSAGMARFSASIVGYISPVNGSNCQSALSAIHQITMWEDARKLREHTFIAVFGCDAQEGSRTSLILITVPWNNYN